MAGCCTCRLFRRESWTTTCTVLWYIHWSPWWFIRAGCFSGTSSSGSSLQVCCRLHTLGWSQVYLILGKCKKQMLRSTGELNKDIYIARNKWLCVFCWFDIFTPSLYFIFQRLQPFSGHLEHFKRCIKWFVLHITFNSCRGGGHVIVDINTIFLW